MTDRQINIAIAEACGIVDVDQWGQLYKTPSGWMRDCPDYCNDLNAMHEAEKVLSSKHNLCTGESQWSSYLEWLGYCWENKTKEVFQCVHAPARQRAEAFLRTLGKWEEVTND